MLVWHREILIRRADLLLNVRSTHLPAANWTTAENDERTQNIRISQTVGLLTNCDGRSCDQSGFVHNNVTTRPSVKESAGSTGHESTDRQQRWSDTRFMSLCLNTDRQINIVCIVVSDLYRDQFSLMTQTTWGRRHPAAIIWATQSTNQCLYLQTDWWRKVGAKLVGGEFSHIVVIESCLKQTINWLNELTNSVWLTDNMNKTTECLKTYRLWRLLIDFMMHRWPKALESRQ